MDFTNELILNGQFGTNGLPIRVSSAQSYRTGVELSLTYNPVKRLSIVNNTSLSANKVRLEEEVLNHVMSPSLMINQEIAYDFGMIDIGIDMKYRSSVYFDLTNYYRIDGAAKFGAYIDLSLGKVKLGAHLNNIFDKRTFSYGMMGASGPLYFVDPARNFFIDIKVSF
jgi:iron complex outermembrane receptor protein